MSKTSRTNPLYSPSQTPEKKILFVLFGAFSDLASRFIMAALYNLYIRNGLPQKFMILAVDQRVSSSALYRSEVQKWLSISPSSSRNWGGFADLFDYQQADITNQASFAQLACQIRKLARGYGNNIVFYAALPPSRYAALINGIQREGLVAQGRARTRQFQRIVLEKPFGRDLSTARSLDRSLHRVFPEDWIYRMDHYQGKGVVQFLFSLLRYNRIIQLLRNWEHISHVEIRANEQLGVGDRGSFYDANGVFRDMFQNHLLELLMLSFLNIPKEIDAAQLERAQYDVLTRIQRINPADVGKLAVGAQYGPGVLRDGASVPAYTSTPNVASNSITPTYGALWLQVKCGNKLVPVFLESGKALDRKQTEICFVYRLPDWLPERAIKEGQISQNRFCLSIDPKQKLQLTINGRRDGLSHLIDPGSFALDYEGQFNTGQVYYPYELLLHRVFCGNRVPFKSGRILTECWNILGPVLSKFSKAKFPLPTYQPGSVRPAVGKNLLEYGIRRFTGEGK